MSTKINGSNQGLPTIETCRMPYAFNFSFSFLLLLGVPLLRWPLYVFLLYIYIYIYILKYILLYFYFLNSYTYACICISSIIMYIAIKVSYIGQYWWRSAIFHTLPTALGREATTRDALVAATSGFLQRGSEVDLGVGWGWVCVCFDFP